MSRRPYPYYHDPYDFSDDSDSDDPDMHIDDAGGESADIEGDGSDTESSTPSTTLESTFSSTRAPSTQSAYTTMYDTDPYASGSDDEGMKSDSSQATWTFRQEYGRGLVNGSDALYRLPADEEERQRLRKQHYMLQDVMRAKYPPGLKKVLASTTYGEKRVLDIGCGNGEWIKDVATDFPLSDCLAIDLVPIRDTRGLPPNVRSEVDDVNLGLQHCYGQFDVVHCRLISSGVKDYQMLIEHIGRILRPGGLVELAEFDFIVYDTNRTQIPISLHDPIGPPYWARWMAYLNRAVRKNGGDVFAAIYLWDWLTRASAFDNIEHREYWIPVIPGNHSEGEERLPDRVYSVVRENVAAFIRAGKPMLCRNTPQSPPELTEEEFHFMESEALRELHLSEETQYTRLQVIWGFKRMDYVSSPDDS